MGLDHGQKFSCLLCLCKVIRCLIYCKTTHTKIIFFDLIISYDDSHQDIPHITENEQRNGLRESWKQEWWGQQEQIVCAIQHPCPIIRLSCSCSPYLNILRQIEGLQDLPEHGVIYALNALLFMQVLPDALHECCHYCTLTLLHAVLKANHVSEMFAHLVRKRKQFTLPWVQFTDV